MHPHKQRAEDKSNDNGEPAFTPVHHGVNGAEGAGGQNAAKGDLFRQRIGKEKNTEDKQANAPVQHQGHGDTA